MNLTVMLVLLLAATITTIASAMNKCPLWVPVFILCIAGLLMLLPVK